MSMLVLKLFTRTRLNSNLSAIILKSMSQQSAPLEKSHLQKYKKPILLSVVIIIVVIVLVSPIIPIQYTVAKTRTRNLRYDSEVYGISSTFFIPKLVNITNQDSIGGSFSVTMKKWSNGFTNGQPTQHLDDTFSQSLYINAGDTEAFHLPNDWFIMSPLSSFTYSVSVPSTQENYNITQTEYKSILSLIFRS